MAGSKKDYEGRLRLDYRMAMDMACPTMEVSAHKTREHATRGINPIKPNAATEAAFYRLVYHIKTLTGPGQYSDPYHQPIIVVVDLNRYGNYPRSQPEALVIGQVIPWSPHFHKGAPICLGETGAVWNSYGAKPLGRLFIQIARLINFDETLDKPGYVGYNGPAINYWRKSLKSRPITPALAYPVIPAWIFGVGADSEADAAAPPNRERKPRTAGVERAAAVVSRAKASAKTGGGPRATIVTKPAVAVVRKP